MIAAPRTTRLLIASVALVAGATFASVPARAAGPFVAVDGRAVESRVEVVDGLIDVRFGFRVAAPPREVYGRLTKFRAFKSLVDGLREVRVQRRKKGYVLRLRGKLFDDYDVRVLVWPSYRKGRGRIRWQVPVEPKPNTGELRVDPAPGGCVVSVATKVRKGFAMPDFFLKLGLRTALAAAGNAFRSLLEEDAEEGDDGK